MLMFMMSIISVHTDWSVNAFKGNYHCDKHFVLELTL